MRKDVITRELTLEWIVGTFMFIILAALIYFTIIIGGDNLFKRTYPFEVYFEDVAGLRVGDNVSVHGMTIGKVDDMQLDDGWVRVRCALDREVVPRRGYRIEIVETSVLGGRQLRIDTGSSDESPMPEGVRLVGRPPIDLMHEAGKTINEIRRALEDDGILEQLAEGSARLNRVAGRLDRGEGTVGALLVDDTIYRDLKTIAANVREATRNANTILGALNRGEGTLGRLLRDDAIARQLDEVLDDVKILTGRLRDGEGTLGRLLTDATLAGDLESVLADAAVLTERLRDGRGSLGKLLAEDSAAYDDLAQTLTSLRTVAQQLEAGEGTLGKLIVDDGIYRQVTALLNDVRATVDDFRESTPLTTFTSILFGAF